MSIRGILKNAPGGVIAICVTVLAVTVVAAFVVLAVTDSDATEFRSWLNTLLNLAGLLLGGTATVAASAAAKSAQAAEQQTNGELDGRIAAAVQSSMRLYGVTSVERGDEAGREPPSTFRGR